MQKLDGPKFLRTGDIFDGSKTLSGGFQSFSPGIARAD